jgi:hypothetical protein
VGDGLKRIAKLYGGLTVTDKNGVSVRYDGNGKIIKRPFGCKCQSLRHKLTGDGCEECNPEYAKQFKRGKR